MALCLISRDFRGEWQCPFPLAHSHICEHCSHLVQRSQRAVAAAFFRNGKQSISYLAHEHCHDVKDRQLFDEFLKEESDDVSTGD